MRKGRRVAFTLIELLVVIAIISILASLLVPAVSGALERGRQAVCSSNQHQIYLGAMSWSGDHNGVFPQWDRGDGFNLLGQGHNSRWLMFNGWQNHGRLYDAEYVGSGAIFYCPSNQTDWFKYSAFQPFPTTLQNTGIRSAFHFNPWTDDGLFRLYQDSTSVIDTVRTLFSVDILRGQEYISHWAREEAAWNVGFVDGSIVLKRVPINSKLMNTILSIPISGRRWTAMLDAMEEP